MLEFLGVLFQGLSFINMLIAVTEITTSIVVIAFYWATKGKYPGNLWVVFMGLVVMQGVEVSMYMVFGYSTLWATWLVFGAYGGFILKRKNVSVEY